MRWLRDDRVGLEFAHETRIDCDPEDARRPAARRHPPQLPATSPFDPSREISSRAESDGRAADDDDAIANSRRTERRHPLVWMGEVYFNHNSEKVRLRNISEHGALIESPINYPLGAEVYCSTWATPASISRPSAGRAATRSGLKFKKPFDLKLLGKRQARSRAAADDPAGTEPDGIGRPGQSLGRRWNRQSLDELRDDLEGYLKR